MHKNAFWLGFLLIVVVLAVWFVIKGGYALMNYYSLNTSATVTIDKWEIDEIREGSYAVVGHFSFEVDGERIEGSSEVGKRYPNLYAAESGFKKVSAKSDWVVWYNLGNPKEATLQKKFPYKPLVSAIILFTLFLYFIALGRYVVLRGNK